MRRTGLALLLLLAAGCAPQELTLLSESELPEDVYGSPEPTPSISPLPRNGFIYLVRGGMLERSPITFQEGEARSLPEALLSALFLQVVAEEDERGSRTERPEGTRGTEIPEGTRLNGVTVAGAVATVDVSVEFEQAAPGAAQALRIAQVVYTLTEEATGVTAVRFEIEGDPLESVPIGGEQVTRTSRAVNRADYVQFDPDARPDEPEG